MKTLITLGLLATLVLILGLLGVRSRSEIDVGSQSGQMGLEASNNEAPISIPADMGGISSANASVADGGYGKISDAKLARILNAGIACRQRDNITEEQEFYNRRVAEGLPAEPLTDEAHAALRKASEACDSEPLAQKADLEQLAIEAARRGNVRAAVCYASGHLKPGLGHVEIASVDDRYRQLVPGFIEQGIKAGDWSAVAVAAGINGPRRAGSVYTQLPPPDPKMDYMYNKMKELGAVGDEKLDLQLVLLDLAKDISGSDRFDAEQEAARLFSSYFSGSGPFEHENTSVCEGF